MEHCKTVPKSMESGKSRMICPMTLYPDGCRCPFLPAVLVVVVMSATDWNVMAFHFRFVSMRGFVIERHWC
jgi:hypothetical protein